MAQRACCILQCAPGAHSKSCFVQLQVSVCSPALCSLALFLFTDSASALACWLQRTFSLLSARFSQPRKPATGLTRLGMAPAAWQRAPSALPQWRHHQDMTSSLATLVRPQQAVVPQIYKPGLEREAAGHACKFCCPSATMWLRSTLSSSACAPAEAIMRALVDVGPVVAYMFVLPPTNPASFYYVDSVFGGTRFQPAYCLHTLCVCPNTACLLALSRSACCAGSYPASACAAGNPRNEINHAVVRASDCLHKRCSGGGPGSCPLALCHCARIPCKLYACAIHLQVIVGYSKPGRYWIGELQSD